MQMKKITAVLAAFMMVATAGIVVLSYTDDSDADPGYYAQNINVFYYNTQTSTWAHSTQGAFNLFEAIKGAGGLGYGLPITAAGNDSWVSGSNPNQTYGVITGFQSISGSYSIKAYDGTNWIDVTNAPLGWVRPFADYGATVAIPGMTFSASANVAIVLEGQTLNIGSGELLTMPTDLSIFSNTYYEFTLRDLVPANDRPVGTSTFSNKTVKVMGADGITTRSISSSDIQGGNSVTICGYGSDAYLALLDAMNGNLVSDNLTNDGKILAWEQKQGDGYTYYTYYSWVKSTFGIETQSDIDDFQSKYWYWEATTSTGGYLMFNFGYFSQLYGAYNVTTGVFNYQYVLSIY